LSIGFSVEPGAATRRAWAVAKTARARTAGRISSYFGLPKNALRLKVGPLSGQYVGLLSAIPPPLLAAAPVVAVAPGGRDRCTGPVFEADRAVLAKNPGVLETLRARLSSPEVDACASVRLLAAGDDVMVVVSLSDGRSTVRQVSSAIDVVDVVETLLTLPTPAPSSSVAGSEAPTPASTRSPEGAAPPAPSPPSPERAAPPPPPPSRSSLAPAPPAETRTPTTACELGLGIAGRLSGRTILFNLSGAALAQLVIHDWLVSARAHGDLPRETPAEVTLTSFGTGLGGGRRIHGRGFDVDATLGADVFFQQQAPASGAVAKSVQPRLVAATRLSEAGPAAFHLYVGADVEVWPGNAQRPQPQMAVWRWWTVSLSFGVKVSPW
jgi:hypothetical protein